MTENITGQGWKLQRGTATGASLPAPGADTFSDVLDIEELTPPQATREVDEWFVLDLVASKKRPGPVSFSPCTAKCTRAYGDLIHNSLEDDAIVAGGQRRNWRIIASDSGQEQRDFVGYVNKFAINALTNKGRSVFDLEILVDGSVPITR
jgi:hypothetical protein